MAVSTISPAKTEGLDIEAIRCAVDEVVGRPNRPIGLHEPTFAGQEWTYVKDCLDSTYVSSVGQYVDRFERMLAEATGAAHAVAVANGTAALHVCLMLAGVEAGDEVFIPSLTFIATANAVSYCRAVPHFVDSSPRTLGLDAAALADRLKAIATMKDGRAVNRQTGRRLAAVMPMHTFGHPVDLDAISQIAADYGIPVIEDAAEALGSLYKGVPVGSRARLAALSFNGNKIITTGAGGAILTNDEAIRKHAKHLTTTAKLPHRWAFVHDEVGYNYRLPNINAALGCAQMEQLAGFVEKKRRLAAAYRDAFAGVPGVSFVDEPAESRSNFWLNAIMLDAKYAGRRDDLLALLNDCGYGARPCWTPMHYLAIYADCPRGDLSTAEDVERRLVNLPSSANLRDTR